MALLPEIASALCLECRLGSPEERVDLMMCVQAREGGRRALVEARKEGTLALWDAPEWKYLLAFCAEWDTPASSLHHEVPLIWLEFDMDRGPAHGLPAPIPFLCAQPRFLHTPPGFDSLQGEAGAGLLPRALGLLLGGPLPPAMEERLFDCISRLPVGGYLLHVAPLAARGLNALRLVLTLPAGEVVGYLHAIGWAGNGMEVEEFIRTLHAGSSHIGIHLDVADAVEPLLAIQFKFSRSDARWAPLFEQLIERGACTLEKREAVLHWPGEEEVTLPGHRWPSRLRREVELKLVSRPHQAIEAKAYLGFAFEFTLF